MAGAVLPLSWGRASVLYSVQRFCMLSGGAPFVARLRFMFLLGFPLPHYPFLWPLPLFLFYISILQNKNKGQKNVREEKHVEVGHAERGGDEGADRRSE